MQPTANFCHLFQKLTLTRSFQQHPVLPTLSAFLVIFLSFGSVNAQEKIDSIYFHPYTDSLKKGTYNYINVDGLLKSGRYLPLDSSTVIFSASTGFFRGNSLWLPLNTNVDKVTISATLRRDTLLRKEITLFVKKTEDGEPLKTKEEIWNEIEQKPKSGKKRSKNRSAI